MGVGLAVFVVLSRRFEWQADAFAAKELSAVIEGPSATRVSPAAVSVVSAALGRVAACNGVPASKRAVRHGSIALRQRRLAALTDRPTRALPIDRQVSALKLGVVAMLVLAVGLTLWSLSP